MALLDYADKEAPHFHMVSFSTTLSAAQQLKLTVTWRWNFFHKIHCTA